MVKINSVVGAI